MDCWKLGVGGMAILVALLSAYFYSLVRQFQRIPEVKIQHWGPGPLRPDDTAIRPFKIHVPKEELEELKVRLNLTRTLVPPLEGLQFQYGMNTDTLNEIIHYWKTSYNWTEREAYLNKIPQFKTQIGGLDIHFLHVRPDPVEGKEVVPLLLVHGWPGSVREFYELVPRLTTPSPDSDVVFELVIPSLPGFGFSQIPVRSTLGFPQAGAILAELMSRLGHRNYYIQAGDWGHYVAHSIAVRHPNRILGFHSNFCLGTTPSGLFLAILSLIFPSLLPYDDAKRQQQYSEQLTDVFIVESAYYHQHATKPDTLGVAMTDSPAGLAAYILEKVSTATEKEFRSVPGGGLERFRLDDLLDNIMIYWITGTMPSAMRFYKENHSWESLSLGMSQVEVPTRCARFPHEVLFFPKFVLEKQYSDLSVTDHPRGGHFAAFEEPDLLAGDIKGFVNSLRKRRVQTTASSNCT